MFPSPAYIRVHCGGPTNAQGPVKTQEPQQQNASMAISEHSSEAGPKTLTSKMWEHLFPTVIISLHSEAVIRAHSK